MHRALGIDRDGHRIIEGSVERPQSVTVETEARTRKGGDDATADFADAAIVQVRKVDGVRTTHGDRPRIAQFGGGGGSPIARVVTNSITGNCADDAGRVHFTHATVIGVWDQYITVRVHSHPGRTVQPSGGR